MTERVIRIGIPPELAKELRDKDETNDWVGKMLCREAASNIISLLVDSGDMSLMDNVDVEFRSDPEVKISDVRRVIWLSDIVLEDENEVEENVKILIYKGPVFKNTN